MESWSIRVDKQYLAFSAAHFLIFPDGSAERLHGHNYRVYAEVDADLSRHGLVIDFREIKPLVRALVDELDERLLVPGEHPELRAETRVDGVLEIRYRERYYAAPAEDVLVLPINNTSAENLAAFLGRELVARLERRHPDLALREVAVEVEESPGQRAVWRRRAG